MLGTIREFAGLTLAESGEEVAFRDRHLAYFLELAEQGREELAGHQQADWIARFDTELDNLRAAMSWALESGDAFSAQAIAGALPRFWEIRGNLTEGRVWTRPRPGRRRGQDQTAGGGFDRGSDTGAAARGIRPCDHDVRRSACDRAGID